MWAAFAALVVVAIIVDLLLLESKGAAKVSFKEALNWSIVWIVLSFVFNALLWWYLDANHGRELANEKSMEFFTGYLIEKSLAVDNIFVFLMLFTFFGVPVQYQRRVLILGIIGAIILRAIMILIGAWLITKFDWILYLFGLFLLVTGVKMLMMAEAESDLEQNPLLRWMRRHVQITNEFHGESFTVMKDGTRWFTPLFVVMVMIGITDVIFAVDSIPAIFAITTDPFIVYTSNIFAILGLRALYFALAAMVKRFHYLKLALAVVLIFIGSKIFAAPLLGLDKIPPAVSLSVTFGILALGVLYSLWKTRGTAPDRLG
jgi:tellurite resistance protein TerC